MISWLFAGNHDVDEQKWTTNPPGVRTIFREDEDILAAQQQAIQENPDKVFFNLTLDAGAMWARAYSTRWSRAALDAGAGPGGC